MFSKHNSMAGGLMIIVDHHDDPEFSKETLCGPFDARDGTKMGYHGKVCSYHGFKTQRTRNTEPA